MQKERVNDSAINWKLVGYTVGGCWIIFALMFLQGRQLGIFLNPLPILLKAVVGILVYGYVGGTGDWEVETIFVYWTMLGLSLAWCLHWSKRNSMTGAIILVGVGLHVVLSVLALFPAMLLAGR